MSRFDKIASVGMFEHVGRKKLPGVLRQDRSAAQARRAGAESWHHARTRPNSGELGSGIGDFIDDYVFPGGELAHLSQVIEEMCAAGPGMLRTSKACGRITRKRCGPGWSGSKPTDRAALAAVGEKTYRIWRIYMAGSAHAFERGWMSVYQVLAGKPLANGALALPLTRDYIYARSDAPS